MNIVRYSAICVVFTMILVLCGCTQNRVSVVNTSSGLIIHASDYGVQTENNKIEKTSTTGPKSTGNVIRLGDGYEKIDLPPMGRF